MAADDLANAHDKIREAVAAGTIADFQPADETEPPPYDDEAAWADRTIDGKWLAEFLTSRSSEIQRYGVLIAGARIVGGLDLEAAEINYRLGLLGCQLGSGELRLVHSALGTVLLGVTRCGGIWAPDTTFAGNLGLSEGFVANGAVVLGGATIAGTLDCAGGTFSNPAGIALNVNGCRVERSVYLREGFLAAGEVNLVGATVGGNVECDGGRFDNPDGMALGLNSAVISGSVLLHGIEVTGEVDLVAANVGSALICTGTLANPDGLALNAVGARFGGSVHLRDGMTASGEVSLAGATIGGTVTCDGSTFSNPGGRALSLAGARITDRVVLRHGFRAEGAVNLVGVSIGGVLSVDGATFANPGGEAFDVDRSRIGNTVILRDCEVEGEVRFVGAVIDGELDCRRAALRNPDGRTLRMDSAQVTGLVNLSHLRSTGEIRLRRSSIGGLLDLDDTHLVNPDGYALDASWTRISGHVRFGRDAQVDGLVSFRQSEAGGLADELSSWPPRISVAGFHYSQLTGRGADQAWRRRAKWLRKQDRPSPDAYVYLAAVYRSVGDEVSARKILIERHNALLHPPAHWGPQRGWLRRWILRMTIGHGYEPWRVLYLVVPIVLAMTLWFAHAKQHDLLAPTGSTSASASDCDSDYTCVQPLVYAVDTLVPLVDFGQRSRWTPDQSRDGGSWYDDGRWLAAATWLTSALGWVIASLVAASFTQVVRRE